MADQPIERAGWAGQIHIREELKKLNETLGVFNENVKEASATQTRLGRVMIWLTFVIAAVAVIEGVKVVASLVR